MVAGRAVTAAAGAGVGPDPLEAVEAALATVSGQLGQPAPDLALVFLGGDYAGAAEAVAERVTERLAPRHLLGVTAGGVVAGASEIEHGSSVAVWAATMPGVEITPLRYPPPLDRPDDAGTGGWEPPPDDATGLVVFADPFTFPAEAYLAWLGHVHPGVPVSGGLASGVNRPGGNRFLLDGEVLTDGAVGIALGGDVTVRTLVSQGCRPVGDSYVVTRAEGNLVQELAGSTPVDRLKEVFAVADQRDRTLLQRGLHIGVVIDEYGEEFGPGDFLVRGVLGAQQGSGAIAVGAVVPVGRTVQFHVRDAESADDDLQAALARFDPGGEPRAGLLFTCNGRGARLFGAPDHDVDLVRASLGDAPLAGFFCAGEFGPVGEGSFLHGFTASVLVLADP